MRPSDAAAIARRAHKGQRYGELPYIEHVRDVVRRVLEDPRAYTDHVVVAYLHDVLEDSPLSVHDLSNITTGQRHAVAVLTRGKGQAYESYIDRVCTHAVATLVKYHDLQSNLEAGNSPSIEQAARYAKALDQVDGFLRGWYL